MMIERKIAEVAVVIALYAAVWTRLLLTPALILAAVILGALRLFFGFKSIAFQAMAHLFVGGLFGAYFAGRQKLLLWLGIGLSVAELAAFLGGLWPAAAGAFNQ
jgi:hypothetical protein